MYNIVYNSRRVMDTIPVRRAGHVSEGHGEEGCAVGEDGDGGKMKLAGGSGEEGGAKGLIRWMLRKYIYR